MSKLTLNDISNFQSSTINVINQNNDAIEVALENTLSRNGEAPNAMNAVLDMNSNRILNLPEPASDLEPVRFGDLEPFREDMQALVDEAEGYRDDTQTYHDEVVTTASSIAGLIDQAQEILDDVTAAADGTDQAKIDAEAAAASAEADAISTAADRIAVAADKSTTEGYKNSAASSASTATTAKDDAVTAKNAAQAAETNVVNLYDSFDDRYLGTKSSDPTVDNDGNTLLQGALYFNSVSHVMKVWDGSAWNLTTPSVLSAFGRTGNVTAQSGDYTVAQITGAAPLASPTFTGTPAAPTPGTNINTTQMPTTEWVNTWYAPKASPTFTGVVTIPTPSNPADDTTTAASTAWVNDAIAAAIIGAGAGDVVGPASSTDNTLVRFNGTSGKSVQSSNIVIDDSDVLTSPGNININKNTAGLLTPTTAALSTFQSADGLQARFELVSPGNAGVVFARACDGTLASPTTISSDRFLGGVAAGGYDTTNGWSTTADGGVFVYSASAWSSTNHETAINFRMTEPNTIGLVTGYLFFSDGAAALGPDAVALGRPSTGRVVAKNLESLNNLRLGRGGTTQAIYMRDNANANDVVAMAANYSDNFLYLYSRGAGISFQNASGAIANLFDNGVWNVKNLVGESLAARDWGFTYGYASMMAGDTGHTGFFEWRLPNDTRQAYMGFDPTNLTLNLENSAKFQVLGGATEFIGTTSGVAAKVRNGYLQLDGSSPGIFFTSPDATSNWTSFHKSDYTWNLTFNGGSEYFKLKSGNQLGLGLGAVPEFDYQGALITSKPAASSQHINLIRSGQYVWSIGYEYNANNFAIGVGASSDSSFTPALKLSGAYGTLTAALRGPLTGENNVDLATAVYEQHVSLSRFSGQSNPLQSALDALDANVGGTIFVPPGTWTIPARCTKTMTGGTINIVGSGSGVSILKWTGSSAGIAITYPASSTPYNNEAPLVRDVSFVTTYSTGNVGPALTFQFNRVETNGSQGPIINNCQFTMESTNGAYWSSGIELINARQTQIMNCSFHGYPATWNTDARGTGISTRGWTVQTNVRDCNFTELGYGQYYGGMSEGIFTDGNAHVNCLYAMYFDGNETAVNGTSSTSNTIGTGSKTFTLAAGKDYWEGMSLFAKNGSNWMQGLVTSYNSGTGVVVIDMTATNGSGTFTSWTITPDHVISDITITNSHANCWVNGFYFNYTAFVFVSDCQLQQGNYAGESSYCHLQFQENNKLVHVHHNIMTDTHYGTPVGVSVQGVSTNDHIRIDTNWFRDISVGVWLHSGKGSNCTTNSNLDAGGVGTMVLTT